MVANGRAQESSKSIAIQIEYEATVKKKVNISKGKKRKSKAQGRKDWEETIGNVMWLGEKCQIWQSWFDEERQFLF